jgi:ABC-type nitrate/sulfonate/bicarbonate transport system ATPase subunit
MTTPKISLQHIAKTYVQNGEMLPVLDEITLAVQPGEFVSLIGPSGCGKSTIFQIITGLVRQDNGIINIDGRETDRGVRKMGYMPQKDLLLPWKRLLDNAVIPLEISGVPRREAETKVRELLPVFGLAGFERAYPSELSGGMRQRAALLRTMLIDSDILLLDEPFGSLDAMNREKMQEWLLSVWEKFRRSVLFITHSIDEAVFLSDRIYVLSDRPARVTLEVAVELPRPRDGHIMTTPEFARYKEILLQKLE